MIDEQRTVPARPTEEMIAAGVEAYDGLCVSGLPASAAETMVRRVFEAVVAAAPSADLAQELRGALAAWSEGDDAAWERVRKKLRDVADDFTADLEFTAKDNLAPSLSAWVEEMTKRAVDAILRGNEAELRRYLGCERSGWTGRSDSPEYGRKREPHEWHPVIHGRLFEHDPVKLRREIVDANRDLITDERVKDLEDQVKALVAQVNQREVEIERLREQLRGYR